jgi:hypothetical protein
MSWQTELPQVSIVDVVEVLFVEFVEVELDEMVVEPVVNGDVVGVDVDEVDVVDVMDESVVLIVVVSETGVARVVKLPVKLYGDVEPEHVVVPLQ